jgi:NADH-quinone oxidoreductase subunit J
MTIYSAIFYILALVILVTTGLAITRRNLVHAVIYLIFSFFGSAMLFYLLGAPILAVLEVIIYAGAIMILFLFIIMMVKMDSARERMFPMNQWLPAAIIGVLYLILGAMVVSTDPDSRVTLKMAMAMPAEFAQFLFTRHWLSIEIVSILLLIACIGALHLGRRKGKESVEEKP